MKKFMGIIGGIIMFAGLIMFVFAQTMISSNPYPWMGTDPQWAALRVIGIVALLWGLVDVIIYFVSLAYTSKTEVDINNTALTTTACPFCGLQVSKDTTVCPKCKNKIK